MATDVCVVALAVDVVLLLWLMLSPVVFRWRTWVYVLCCVCVFVCWRAWVYVRTPTDSGSGTGQGHGHGLGHGHGVVRARAIYYVLCVVLNLRLTFPF